jgi:hypothetical protein
MASMQHRSATRFTSAARLRDRVGRCAKSARLLHRSIDLDRRRHDARAARRGTRSVA